LPGDEFYYVVQELGLDDALEVLVHATPEQIQTALDFAVWDRDQVSLAHLDHWLGALTHAPYETIGRWAKGLDVELLAFLLRKRARIYDLSLEELPDEPEGTLYETPDRLFALDFRGEEDEVRVTMQLVEALYRHDQEWARRILVGSRGELDVELEETALRWRAGRMADLGFEDFYEALEVYREIDPATVRAGEHPSDRVRPHLDDEPDGALRVPTALADRLGDSGHFARAVAGISSAEELANVHASLVALSNRVLSADRITPGDEEAMGPVLRRVSATLDLAVEFLARGNRDEAVRAVRTIPLVRLFQLGFSLGAKVRRLAVTLKRQTPFARMVPPLDLFEDEDAAVLDAVMRMRPLFPCTLDEPPAPGERPFAALADLGAATRAIERAGAAVALTLGLGLRPDAVEPAALAKLGVEPAALDTGVIGRTILARRLLGLGGPPLTPLSAAELEALTSRLGTPRPGAAASLREALAPTLAAAWPGPLSVGASSVVERWLDGLLHRAVVLGRGDAMAPR
jgi:hypothetical protein